LCENWEISKIERGCEFSSREIPSSLIYIVVLQNVHQFTLISRFHSAISCFEYNKSTLRYTVLKSSYTRSMYENKEIEKCDNNGCNKSNLDRADTSIMDYTKNITITLPISMIEEMDKKRGDIPRSKYIRRVIEGRRN
jgi:hypothetical protein